MNKGLELLPHPEHQTFFSPTNDLAFSSFTCSASILFFTFFFIYIEREREGGRSQQRSPEDTSTQLVLGIETREARQTDIIIIPI